MDTHLQQHNFSTTDLITIVDYGMGNLGSLANMLRRIGVSVTIESELEGIQKAKKLVLPGVGSFDTAMSRLRAIPDLIEILDEKAMIEKIPILGICLGMQLLTSESEEGSNRGLNWISGKTIKFRYHKGLKVPHMGWNNTNSINNSSLTNSILSTDRFYFMHSYYVKVENRSEAIMTSNYGVDFDAVIGRDNIFGVQFHPEKSHKYGLQILTNFCDL